MRLVLLVLLVFCSCFAVELPDGYNEIGRYRVEGIVTQSSSLNISPDYSPDRLFFFPATYPPNHDSIVTVTLTPSFFVLNMNPPGNMYAVNRVEQHIGQAPNNFSFWGNYNFAPMVLRPTYEFKLPTAGTEVADSIVVFIGGELFYYCNGSQIGSLPLEGVWFGRAFTVFCNHIPLDGVCAAGNFDASRVILPSCIGNLSHGEGYFEAILASPDGSCLLSQIAANASAFITGNNGRYEQYDLNCNDRTIIPVPLTSPIPFCNNMDCHNAAVSLDDRFNLISDGWSTNATQGIWVDPENLNCDSANDEGYFVFCSRNGGGNGGGGGGGVGGIWDNVTDGGQLGQAGGGTIRSGGLGLDGTPLAPDRIDTVKFVSPANGNNEELETSTGLARIIDLIVAMGKTLQDGFNGVTSGFSQLGQIMRNGFDGLSSSVNSIYNWLVNFGSDDNPTLDIPLDENAFDYDGIELEEMILDTVPPVLDSSAFDIDTTLFERIKDELLDTASSLFDTTQFSLDMLDTLLPEKISDTVFAETVADLFKEMFDDIQEKVSENLAPLQNLIGGDGGGCNCLADEFLGLSFSGVGVSAPGWAVAKICESIDIIRIIVLLISMAGNIGLILWVLRS